MFYFVITCNIPFTSHFHTQKCPWDASLRELRVEAYQAVGDIMNAIADVRVTTKLVQDNTHGYLRLARLYYSIGDVEQSLR